MERVVIGKRFGDEYSTLLDEFERKSFEDHLNRSMMMGRRSFSEPARRRRRRMMMMMQTSPSPSSLLITMPPPPPPLVTQQHNSSSTSSGSSSSRFQRVLKKLFKPILGRKKSGRNNSNMNVPHDHYHHPKDLFFSSKEFSKSLRF
ncbi:hypothetical protein PIB30_038902 [Stylosanthes scabra]|uniref:Uncharacterized protein n=1 Tax=Stylosanthes scabra TaxID=79078 RepID=A0ABU6QDP0_9FABA|nr:hypothetical protein [Stylosanthes scabra]